MFMKKINSPSKVETINFVDKHLINVYNKFNLKVPQMTKLLKVLKVQSQKTVGTWPSFPDMNIFLYRH